MVYGVAVWHSMFVTPFVYSMSTIKALVRVRSSRPTFVPRQSSSVLTLWPWAERRKWPSSSTSTTPWSSTPLSYRDHPTICGRDFWWALYNIKLIISLYIVGGTRVMCHVQLLMWIWWKIFTAVLLPCELHHWWACLQPQRHWEWNSAGQQEASGCLQAPILKRGPQVINLIINRWKE